ELGGGTALLVKPLDDVPIGGLVGRQELEGDVAVELGIECAEDRSHTAGADGFLEAEGLNELADLGQGHRDVGRGGSEASPGRAARSPQERERGIRLAGDAVDLRRVRQVANGMRGTLGWSARLGAQHRLVLSGLGSIPWQNILAPRSMRIRREMSRDRVIACKAMYPKKTIDLADRAVNSIRW